MPLPCAGLRWTGGLSANRGSDFDLGDPSAIVSNHHVDPADNDWQRVRSTGNEQFVRVIGHFVLAAGVASLLPAGLAIIVFETLVFAAQSVPGGYDIFRSVNLRVRESELTPVDAGRPNRWLGIVLPVGSALLFGTIFLFANPQLLRVVSSYLVDLIADFKPWLRHFSFVELLFGGAVAWLTAGALRPIRLVSNKPSDETAYRTQTPSSMYQPFQRTLLTVIALFAGYLVFEFYTLSSNTCEKGFGFSDYAHEGAMWLTVALTLATLMLSLIF